MGHDSSNSNNALMIMMIMMMMTLCWEKEQNIDQHQGLQTVPRPGLPNGVGPELPKLA